MTRIAGFGLTVVTYLILTTSLTLQGAGCAWDRKPLTIDGQGKAHSIPEGVKDENVRGGGTTAGTTGGDTTINPSGTSATSKGISPGTADFPRRNCST